MITVCCSVKETGIVYKGKLDFKETLFDFSNLKNRNTEVMFIAGDPDNAFIFIQMMVWV
jgi:phosphoenolpyruvate synthase/pyruvate phosphate dikinase